jgi:hypothetical protein
VCLTMMWYVACTCGGGKKENGMVGGLVCATSCVLRDPSKSYL